jgi:alpha-N-acetylglucosaminidase
MLEVPKMAYSHLLLFFLLSFCIATPQATTEGIKSLVQRLLPNHVDSFEFHLDQKNATDNDSYNVSSASNGKISVAGNSVSALAVG